MRIYFLFWLTAAFAARIDEQTSGYYCYTDGHLHVDDPCRFFAAVIDAGSTGTRLHLYRFVHNTHPHSLPFVTEEEIVQEVKPGLSSFNEDPHGAARTVRQLLDKAHSVIPPELWEKTPITLKATAGLRLLPKGQAEEILASVQAEFASAGFFQLRDSVEILDGQDEGVFSWFTLNLLLNTLYKAENGLPADPDPRRSVAAFDLGGGSTQVTFWPSDETIFENLPESRKEIDFFDAHMHLFSHSFLGNGLLSARLGTLQAISHVERLQNNEFINPCMPVDFEIPKWNYALREWRVRGSAEYSHQNCKAAVNAFVQQSDIAKLSYLQVKRRQYFFDELKGKPIFLFSYFFDRALNSGIVSDSNGGRTTLQAYDDAAHEACARSAQQLQNGAHWLAWQCMDLLYIHALLTTGYGFNDSQPIVLIRTVDGMNVSWAQGLAYSLVNSFHEVSLPDVLDSRVNTTGSPLVDQFLTILLQRTDDFLRFFQLIS